MVPPKNWYFYIIGHITFYTNTTMFRLCLRTKWWYVNADPLFTIRPQTLKQFSFMDKIDIDIERWMRETLVFICHHLAWAGLVQV